MLLLLWCVLMAIHAIFVAFQFALVQVRYSNLDAASYERLSKLPGMAALLERSDVLSRIIRLCANWCIVGTGIVICLLLWQWFEWLATGHSWWDFLWLSGVAVLMVLCQYLFSEIIPRGWSMKHPDRVLRYTTWLVMGFVGLSSPFRYVLRSWTKVWYRWMNIDADTADFSFLDVEVQTRALGDEANVMSPVLKRIVKSTLKIRDLAVSDIMLPRREVEYLDTELSMLENLRLAKEYGHTRYPLCQGDLDTCLGLLHIKDLFRESTGNDAQVDLMSFVRPVHRFRENEPVEKALQVLLTKRMHMALVTDEFDGISGVLTMEQILEELVGEIQDEFDSEELPIAKVGEGLYQASAAVVLHDLSEALQMDFQSEEVSTLGGLIILKIGRIPSRGEVIRLGRLEVTIKEVTEKRIISVHLRVQP